MRPKLMPRRSLLPAEREFLAALATVGIVGAPPGTLKAWIQDDSQRAGEGRGEVAARSSHCVQWNANHRYHRVIDGVALLCSRVGTGGSVAAEPMELDMSDDVERTDAVKKRQELPAVDMKLEVVVIPVSDVDRAKRFYGDLGWRLDADIAVGDAFRVVQFTPPGSPSSIHFGIGLTSAVPGSVQGLYLVVSDIEAAHAELAARGVDASEVSYRTGPGQPTIKGRDPERRTYNSFTSFKDPDGNGWLLQEITTRLPGRVDGDTTFASPAKLAAALRRAAEAHGEHEKRRGGQRDDSWPDWYAEYIVAEQTGKPLPA
ncbi:glyoxalase [Mesorhizobium sp. LNJC394B00]|nr:glyoxalase [Mesorhizobium sp. LNJC394B00]